MITRTKNVLKTIISLIIIFTQFAVNSSFAQSTNTLWYKQPAQYFEESLVLGNGRMGACVFGGVASDKIYLNDATLWSGGPVNANIKPEAYKNLQAVRDALKNEDYKLADSLNKQLQGANSEAYAPLGTAYIDFKHTGKEQNYRRELNINEAISKVSYEVDGVKFTREYFVSYPDKVMVIRLTSSRKGALNFDLKFKSLLKNTQNITNGIMETNGFAPYSPKPKYLGYANNVNAETNNGIRFSAFAKIKNTDGIVQNTDSTLSVQNATEALIYISVATSFNGFDKNPATEGLNASAIGNEQLAKASTKSFLQLKENHLLDYQKFFNRVSLSLGKTKAPNLPTDERLKRYAEGKEDKNLEVLYFQFGRYLLISCSRTPGVPANLQGIWNEQLRPKWNSNYTTNINLEENYWLAENANLSELHQPLMGFIKNLSVTGKVTAKTFYGVNGWCAGHNSDIWALSNPVGEGTKNTYWVNWTMGGAWLSTHLWEHYIFTQDKSFLQNEAYEIMRGAAQFCLEWLIEDKNGKLITSPSTSPENTYVTSEGYRGGTLYGSTADLAIIRECFQQTINAATILNIDADFKAKLQSALSRLHPYQIGKKGNLQEWYYDWEDNDPKHRHQSHLFGLYPGHHITPSKTLELANACRKTLEIKGDETTGWSKGWRINLWARLGDGNHSYKMYRELLKYVEATGPDGKVGMAGGTYANLLDAHPPFQIDGNFGGAAGVVEMLLQSNENEIKLLPALPDAWDSGAVKGICARGGFEISMKWKNKALKKVSVYAKNGGTTTLVSANKQVTISLKKGERREVQNLLK